MIRLISLKQKPILTEHCCLLDSSDQFCHRAELGLSGDLRRR